MGAQDFTQGGSGKTAQLAFSAAVQEALHEYGHRGYTGSLAEKHEFVVIDLPDGADPHEYADKLIQEDDPRISNKWGPAGAIHLGGEEWLFFGWASS